MPNGGVGLAAIPHDRLAGIPRCEDQGNVPPCLHAAFLQTNRSAPEVDLLRYYDDDGSSQHRPYLQKEGVFPITTNSPGSDSRGIAIDHTQRRACELGTAASPGADPQAYMQACAQLPARVFIASRSPPSIIVGQLGQPTPSGQGAYNPDQLVLIGNVPMTVGPSNVYLAPVVVPDGMGGARYALRVFVVCFDSNRHLRLRPRAAPCSSTPNPRPSSIRGSAPTRWRSTRSRRTSGRSIAPVPGGLAPDGPRPGRATPLNTYLLRVPRELQPVLLAGDRSGRRRHAGSGRSTRSSTRSVCPRRRRAPEMHDRRLLGVALVGGLVAWVTIATASSSCSQYRRSTYRCARSSFRRRSPSCAWRRTTRPAPARSPIPFRVAEDNCGPVATGVNTSTLEFHLMATVTQPARGELAVVDLTAGNVIDEDKTTGGIQFIPVGAIPTDVVHRARRPAHLRLERGTRKQAPPSTASTTIVCSATTWAPLRWPLLR